MYFSVQPYQSVSRKIIMRMQNLGNLLSIVSIVLLAGAIFTGTAIKSGGVSSQAHALYSGTISIIAIAALAINLWQIQNKD